MGRTSQQVAHSLALLLEEKKGIRVRVLDLSEVTLIADCFVVASGRSTVHTRALAEAVEEKMKDLQVYPRGIEGKQEGSWILMDYDSVVLHLFTDEYRKFYNLEKLWSNARVTYPDMKKG